MATGVVRSCQCGLCGSGIEHRDVEYHRQMNLLLSRLDEQQRRWYLAVESQRLGRGADRLLFEIQFCLSRFGAHYPPVTLPAERTASFEAFVRDHSWLYPMFNFGLPAS